MIIDETEAMTVIDVNSGKYTGKDDFEDTVYRINLEASIEIPASCGCAAWEESY